MKAIALEKNELNARELAALAKHETIILTRRGKPVVAVKDVSGFDWESVRLADSPRLRKILQASRREFEETGGIPLAAAREQLGLNDTGTKRKRRKTAV